MEIAIGLGIGVIIGLLTGHRKRAQRVKKVITATSKEERQRKADEELITVVLPTISKD